MPHRSHISQSGRVQLNHFSVKAKLQSQEAHRGAGPIGQKLRHNAKETHASTQEALLAGLGASDLVDQDSNTTLRDDVRGAVTNLNGHH